MAQQRRGYGDGKRNPLEAAPTLIDVDAATYGTVADMPASGRIVARAVPILELRPDRSQPRRTLPSVLRGMWSGRSADMPQILSTWVDMAWAALGTSELPRNIKQIIESGGDGDLPASAEALVTDLFALVGLAGSIHRNGLINPIHATRGGMIESGERRWLAYHLLQMFGVGDYSTIPTVQKGNIDPWLQAAENGSRSPLDAIGMARQLALLVMAMYEGDEGIAFDDYDALVLPGAIDRGYYAQVANGSMFSIKRGMLQKILQVTGLKSKSQVSQYRALLAIPDDLWLKADAQHWTEFEIREYVASLKAAEKEPIGLRGVNLSPESDYEEIAPERGAPTAPTVPNVGLYGGSHVQPEPESDDGQLRYDEDEDWGNPDDADDVDYVARFHRDALFIYASDPDDDDDDDYVAPRAPSPARKVPSPEGKESSKPKTLSTKAILDDVKWGAAIRLLAYVKGTASRNDPLAAHMQELMTVSDNDISYWVNLPESGAEWWEDVVGARNEAIVAHLNAHLKQLEAYLDYLVQVGNDLHRPK